MKKATAVLAVMVMVVSLVSLAFAAEMKGTIKSVDTKAGTAVFCAEGTNTDVTLKADKAVDLSKVKAGDKVEVSVEKDTLMGMKAAAAEPAKRKNKSAVGC
jgi:cold shock CspA family protein